MTRAEWYKHATADKVEAVVEYVQVMRDGVMETNMPANDIERLYSLLCNLQYDIFKQLKEYE